MNNVFYRLNVDDFYYLTTLISFTTTAKYLAIKEAEHQKKIIDHLTALNFWVVKTTATNIAGITDIIAIAPPCGQTWLIEAKKVRGRVEPLQMQKLIEGYTKGAVTMVAYGYEDFLQKLKYLDTVERFMFCSTTLI